MCRFQLKPEMGFTAGQQAYSDYFELTLQPEQVLKLQDSAVEEGMGCHRIAEGQANICYVICTRYNFWEGCTTHPGAILTPDAIIHMPMSCHLYWRFHESRSIQDGQALLRKRQGSLFCKQRWNVFSSLSCNSGKTEVLRLYACIKEAGDVPMLETKGHVQKL